jgi:ribosomal protein S18 acetylase RimI-like enzyme
MLARQTLIKEFMNPLSLQPNCMVIAYNNGDNDNAINRSDNGDAILGFGQIRPLNDRFSELASLYVFKQYRQQGIGSQIVQELLNRHNNNNNNKSIKDKEPALELILKVCLLTLRPTMKFYQKYNFREVSRQEMEALKLPFSMKLEAAAGSAISAFLGNDLVCMVLD